MMAPISWELICGLFKNLYAQIPNQHVSSVGYQYILTTALIPTLVIIGLTLIVAAFIAALADFIQVGPLVAIAPLIPKLDKLNPSKYFKNTSKSKFPTFAKLLLNFIIVSKSIS